MGHSGREFIRTAAMETASTSLGDVFKGILARSYGPWKRLNPERHEDHEAMGKGL